MTATRCDVLIIGAGPAGLAAALRLQQLGYAVVVVERQATASGNIGEALTPGIFNLLDFLDAGAALDVATAPPAPIRQRWRSGAEELRPADPRSRMVDRQQFDTALLDQLLTRGGRCIRPAQVTQLVKHEDGARVTVEAAQQQLTFDVRRVIDARGRAATGTKRHALAPPLLAIWLEIPNSPTVETRIEALEDGWLWGAMTAGGRHRIIAICDPQTPRAYQAGQPEVWFQDALCRSRMFRDVERSNSETLRACAAGAAVASTLDDGLTLRTGDAALTLDPLSSSGVEKTMRLALQAATAVHTELSSSPDRELAAAYYRQCVIESAARHVAWTRQHYQAAWPADDAPFWRAQRAPAEMNDVRQDAPLVREIHEAAGAIAAPTAPRSPLRAETLGHDLHRAVRLAPACYWIELPCVVADRVQRRPALMHPELARPLAFIEDVDLHPLLTALPSGLPLSVLLQQWSARLAPRQAPRLAGWLLAQELLIFQDSTTATAVSDDRFEANGNRRTTATAR